jgi:hypothetical protein
MAENNEEKTTPRGRARGNGEEQGEVPEATPQQQQAARQPTNATEGDKPAAGTDAQLSHTEGGISTRDDALDSGAPMLPGSPDEPVGPEDALGSGPKRGNYEGLIGTQRFQASVPNPNYDPEDPSSPRSVLVDQNPLVEQVGDDPGVKGGTKPLTDEV